VATADELFLQGVAAHRSGDFAAAERCYRLLLEADPNHAPTLTNLGSLLARRGQGEEAERLYRTALAANPDQLDAHFNLGNLHRRLGRLPDAITEYEEALRIDPDAPHALLNLGLALGEAGDWPRAAECFTRALNACPETPEGLNLLGDALAHCGRRDEAIASFRASVERFPEAPRGHHNLGIHLAMIGQTDEAIASFERAITLAPNYAEAHNALGVALDAAGQPDDAQSRFRAAIRLREEFAEAWGNLGTSLCEQGQVEEGLDSLRRSLAITPSAQTHSTLLMNLLFSARVTAEQLKAEHVAWATAYADSQAPESPLQKRNNDRVRVGYVFDEFRSRAAFAFLETLLAHHDRNAFHVTAYPNSAGASTPFDSLQKLADSWKLIADLNDERAAELIRADEIDILVDVSGHNARHRLLLFARRPAATQVSLFGYPATTGLGTMNYRVSDALTDPPGETDSFYTEKLLQLPDLGWVYVPPADAPVPNSLPAARGRPFTFGCLNHPAKLSSACLEVWATILKSVPKARLVLLAGRSAASRNELTDAFTKLGIASDRLELLPRRPASDYFEAYQPIDLALDPFPYNGSVTTCDALWMGVPVLTVAGRDARARQGVSLLTALGLPEFVADTPEQLVSLAATWAEQHDALADLRASLRDMMNQSPLTDAANYVKHLEAAYRSVS